MGRVGQGRFGERSQSAATNQYQRVLYTQAHKPKHKDIRLMAAKKLQEGSEYAEYDADGDGIVTDEELQTSKELQELRLRHERADAQRAMSWFALWGMLLYPSLVVASELFGLNQAASILGDMAAVYFVSVAGILAAFFGAQAWSNRSNGSNR